MSAQRASGCFVSASFSAPNSSQSISQSRLLILIRSVLYIRVCHATEIIFSKVCPVSLPNHSSTPMKPSPQWTMVVGNLLKGRGVFMRVSVALALCCLCTLSFAADPAHASIRKDLNVPAEELGSALQTVAKDYDFQVLYRTEIVKDLRTQGAVGSLTSDEALGKVLKGTGLTYKYLDSNTVTIYSVATGSTSSNSSPAPAGSAGNADTTGGGKKSSQDFRVAQVDQGKGSQSAAVGNQASSAESSNGQTAGLSEIIVTAQKREERLQDVPVPVSVLTAGSLEASNKTRVQDYYETIPALNISPSPGAGGEQVLSIRGISTGYATNPTVGVTVDGISFGSTTSFAGNFLPDLDPGDLARVEVLRGPQGTLYGASSLGGLINFVTLDPSTDGFSGHVQAGASGVQHSSEVGYEARGAVNVPVSELLAIRASGFVREDPGYIDNVAGLGKDDVNEHHAYGGHLAALFKPTDAFSLKLSALYQSLKSDGGDYINVGPGLQGFQQNTQPGVGGYDSTIQAYSLLMQDKVGIVNLTSSTAYNVSKQSNTYDNTTQGGAASSLFFFGVGGAAVDTQANTQKFTQEIRINLPIGSKLDWLVGGYYTHEMADFTQTFLAVNPVTGAIPGSWEFGSYPGTYAEWAAFTDLTYHVTDRFDIQFGGRESIISQSLVAIGT